MDLPSVSSPSCWSSDSVRYLPTRFSPRDQGLLEGRNCNLPIHSPQAPSRRTISLLLLKYIRAFPPKAGYNVKFCKSC